MPEPLSRTISEESGSRVPAERRDWRLMRRMFSTVAPRYDFITRTFSYGMDRRWKKLGVSSARLPESGLVLDLASGTGDFSTLVGRRYPGVRTVAVDLTEGMLRLARLRGVECTVCADANHLPFPDGSFDSVFIGYGLRNFTSLRESLGEIRRVMRPGGTLVTLDFFLPAGRLFRPLYLAYLYLQGAFWGLLLHGRPRVYTYIPDSLRSFHSMAGLTALLRESGYTEVKMRPYLGGGIGLHWAVKTDAATRVRG